MFARRRLFASVFTLLACAFVAAGSSHAGEANQGPRLPIEHFFQNEGFSGALLSPDARHLAVRVGGEGKRDRLGVFDLESFAVKVVASFSDADVGDFEWVSNDRLIFNSRDKGLGEGELNSAPGLFAVDRDGRRFQKLANRGGEQFVRDEFTKALLPWHTYLMHQRGAQDSVWVYVISPAFTVPGEASFVDLLRLNTVTGRNEQVKGPPHTRNWMLDNKGEPRIVSTVDGGTESIWYRDPATSEWRKLVEFVLYKSGKGAFTPLGFGPDGTLYVTTDADGDKRRVHRFDFATDKVGEKPLVTVGDYDFQGGLLTTQDKLLGVWVLSNAIGDTWFDAGMTSLQARIDKALPDTVNLLSVAARAATPWVLVQSYSDVQPRFTSLFNSATGKLTKVGESYPKIDPARMATQKTVSYKARDGLTIPALLTLPQGSTQKDLPLVVLVHGGPYVRGSQWGWNSQSQFLASRGYAVLEPEFRGSKGFGTKHFRAGWKQWGLAMQDDIADGAKWAIAEGIVDPKRICIAGASYGGYATLMGLANDPGLFKCGIDWLGVTDLKLLYTGHWWYSSDMSQTYKQYGFPELIGDPVKDAAQFKATSPIEQAARITQPLLLAYGGADKRVPLNHGKEFYAAVKRTNPDVEWVVYDEEGHGWRVPKNRIDFWTRVEKFLDRNIGKP
jgi:dipeptidyl aminopeptidase/acylaminoacyl peptidase